VLARRGHQLTLVNASEALLAHARERVPGVVALRAQLETLDSASVFDGIVCRGVLHYICSAADRTEVLRRFASHLGPGGVVVIDVRELGATVRPYGEGRTAKRELRTPRGVLTFESTGRMEGRMLRISEHHELRTSSRALTAVRVRDAAVDHRGARRPARPGRLRCDRDRRGRWTPQRRLAALSSDRQSAANARRALREP
jgi:SAM-dependent methyltransferase